MMTFFLAATTNEPTGLKAVLERYLPYQGIGLLVVLITLTVLSGVCAFVGVLFGARMRRQSKAKAAVSAAAATTPGPAPAASIEEEVTDPRTVAAIAAAITVALARPYRIIEIQAAGHPVGMTSAWAIEGRFQHFSSHKVR